MMVVLGVVVGDGGSGVLGAGSGARRRRARRALTMISIIKPGAYHYQAHDQDPKKVERG